MKQKKYSKIMSAIFFFSILLIFIACPLRAQWNYNNLFSPIYTSPFGPNSNPFPQSQNTIVQHVWSPFNASSQSLYQTIIQITIPQQKYQYPYSTTYNTTTSNITSNPFAALSTFRPFYSSPYSFPTSPVFAQFEKEEEE